VPPACATRAVESVNAAYLPKPPPPAAAGGCPVPNTTGLHASVFGKWYRAYGTGYTGAGSKNNYDGAGDAAVLAWCCCIVAYCLMESAGQPPSPANE
jgi:hypothetical protein